MTKARKFVAMIIIMSLAAVSIGAGRCNRLNEIIEISPQKQEILEVLAKSEEANKAIIDIMYHLEEGNVYVDGWTKRMSTVHELKQQAKALGLEDDDPIIVKLEEILESDYYDLQMVAKTISREAAHCPQWHQVAVGAVVMNRVKDPRFPDTVYGVLAQTNPMQYTPEYTYDFAGISDQYYQAAIDAIDGNHDVPENVVWQAQFFQGGGIWRTSAVNTGYWSSVTYFCY